MPEICDARVKKRNRSGENIPLDYLIDCHKYHESWLQDKKILVIDGNIDTLQTNETIENTYYDLIMENVFTFIV